ncbi:MAG: peptidylprolyl isomerase [Pseudomonadota bacterium]|nr:peptidylprolyl isomerase [Pseudomonadota bacterium]
MRSIVVAFVAVGALASPLSAAFGQAASSATSSVRSADFILAVVNQELVTAAEVEQRLLRVRESAKRSGTALPPDAELRQQLLDLLIDERAQVTYARENGPRIDEGEVDRAVANVAAQNQVTVAQLRQRLAEDGIEYSRFRKNIREQMLVERVREREVQARIRISDAEIDAVIERQRAEAATRGEYNIAQILVSVPDNASDAVVAERKAIADAALARVKAGEPFEAVARAVSEDSNKEQGGAIGLRAADRLPDLFVERVRSFKIGQVADAPLRTGAGFHLLKLVDRRDGQAFSVTETHAHHILLRVTAQLDQASAMRRLAELKRQILDGSHSFEQLAKENSEDGSAAQGGDLGWAPFGTFVPEFHEAMNALPIGGLSDPVVSRFGVHLIQVNERRQAALDSKQERDQARNQLREKKYEAAYADWSRDLRARAYVELREPPQ